MRRSPHPDPTFQALPHFDRRESSLRESDTKRHYPIYSRPGFGILNGISRCREVPFGSSDSLARAFRCNPDVERVLLDPENGVIASLKEGALIIDCSSIAPEATRRFAEQFRAKNIGYVDAPVSGGSEGAIKGTLTIMCGGTEEDFERAEPVLQIIGAKVTRIGPVGCGQIAKVANQVAIAGTFMALAEALTLAYRAGANPERVVDAIGGGVAGSWILNNRSEKMLNDDYPLGFRTRLHRKDLGIALDTAKQFKVPVPIASLVATIEDALIAQGYGDEDMSNLARFIREGAGIPNGPMKA